MAVMASGTLDSGAKALAQKNSPGKARGLSGGIAL